MASTILELTRSSHEQVERLERLIVKELINNNHQQRRPQSSTHHHQHLIRNLIDHIKSTTHKLIQFYQDQDSAMKDDEIATLGSSSEDRVFGLFYDRAKEITQFHRRRRPHHHHPASQAFHEDCDDQDSELLQQLMTKRPPVFSGEEGYGRYLDLHELYNDYINSKFGHKNIDYLSYLQVFSLPIPPSLKLKSKRQYREYLNRLLGYLASFLERTQPLLDLERLLSKLTIEFHEEQWRRINHDSHNDLHSANINIDLDSCSTAEELLQLAGPDKLKEALAALGLKTGGTIHQLAHRLFLTKHTPLDQLDTRHFACRSEDIALTEAKVEKLCELLQETIIRTQQYVEKKQALTYSEMEAEREEMIEEVRGADHNVESEEEEQHEQEATPIISNPLKLPMGWDGKPIPYWLYKLHGLGKELKCEICGDHSYRGRQAYERHFKELRHQQGMRRLGMQNTNDFNEITSIEEARQLWKRIKRRQSANKWEPDLEEEYEDEEGNIYPRKTYTDLQRQGLI